MLNLFKIERNSPCECGSGRKYKRCCMGAVDELLSRWRREKIWPNLDLLRPLALACGLEADKDGYPLHPERIEKALALMAEAMAMGSEDQVVDEMMNYVHRLGALLDTGGELNAQLFPIHKLFAILNEMDAELMESSGEADINGLFDEFGVRYLPTLEPPASQPKRRSTGTRVPFITGLLPLISGSITIPGEISFIPIPSFHE